jgi:ABC-type glycerol-3-phosphate transport system permease component
MNIDFKDLCKTLVATAVMVFGAVLIICGIVWALAAVFEPSPETKAAMRVPQLMSEADGCRVYRFVDNGTHYFTRCGAQVETIKNYTESCGKGCTRARTESITTEDNK